MHQQLQNRLKELKAEFEAGQKRLAELEAQQVKLRDTLLRISGAIQVLEEELSKSGMDAESKPGQSIGNEKNESKPEIVKN